MQTAILSLLLACCSQVDDEPVVRLEPRHVILNDRDPATREIRPIALNFPAGHVGPLKLNDAEIDARAFDRWVYGEDRPAGPRLELQDKLRVRINSALREYELNDVQKEKLRLAGNGDIKRFLEQVAQRRAEFEAKRHAFKEGRDFLRGLMPLIRAYKEGPFGDGSMFAKTLEKMKRERASAMMMLRTY